MPSEIISETDSNHDHKGFDWPCGSVALPLWSLDHKQVPESVLARADFGVQPRPTPDPPPWTQPLPLESEKACARNKLVGLNTALTIGKLRAETLKSEFLVWNLSSILYKC